MSKRFLEVPGTIEALVVLPKGDQKPSVGLTEALTGFQERSPGDTRLLPSLLVPVTVRTTSSAKAIATLL